MKRIFISILISLLCFSLSSCTYNNPLNSPPKESDNEIKNKRGNSPPALEVNITKNTPISLKKTENQEYTDVETTPEKVTTVSLSDKKYGWGFRRGSNGSFPDPGTEYSTLLSKYNGYYIGDKCKKFLYLTFDNGYENGFTPKILDTLKDNNVQATFFVTNPYLKENPDLIKRMVNEGHIVGNHSTTHPSMPSIQNFTKFKYQLETIAETYKNITGEPMKKFFRPPMGEFSERSLYYTKELGYKSIFWSFAYDDWNPNSQPSKEQAIKNIKKNMHNGEIFLLHSVSKTNCEILDQIIKYWKSEGYEIKSIEDL